MFKYEYNNQSTYFIKFAKVEGGEIAVPISSIKFVETIAAKPNHSIIALDNGEKFAIDCSVSEFWNAIHPEEK